MLHDGGKGNRHDSQNGREHQCGVTILKHSQNGLLLMDGEAYPCRIGQRCKVDHAHEGCNDIRHDDTQQNGDNLDDALAPYRRDDDGDDRDNGQQPVGLTVSDGRAREHQSDGDNDRTGNNRWEVLQNLLHAKRPDERSHDKIHQSGAGHT